MLRHHFRRTSSIVATLSENPGFNTITVPKLSDCVSGVYNGYSKLINYGKSLVHGPTAEEITANIDLTGKTCLITGGTSGIGLEMIRVLILRNCNVIMACRNVYAASTVAKKIPGGDRHLDIYETNLSSLASVKKLSDNLIKDNRKIDILILNAAVFALPWTLTIDGLESIFQINYLSQYYLLQNIETLLSDNARVVFMSSESHRNLKLEYDYMNPLDEYTFSLPKEKYTSIKAYNLSKFCGITAMHSFAYRWMKMNVNKSIFCAHPGSFVRTNLPRNWWVWDTLYTIVQPFTKTVPQAAATPIYCCTSLDLNGLTDMYYKNCKYCSESDQARDLILSYRVDALTRSILAERLEYIKEVTEQEDNKPVKLENPVVYKELPTTQELAIC